MKELAETSFTVDIKEWGKEMFKGLKHFPNTDNKLNIILWTVSCVRELICGE